MEFFLFLLIAVLFVIVLILHNRTRNLQRRLTGLERQMGLGDAASTVPSSIAPSRKDPSFDATGVASRGDSMGASHPGAIPSGPSGQPAATGVAETGYVTPAAAVVPVQAAVSPATTATIGAQPSASSASSALPPPIWKKIERQLVENWTGIVGAIILTAGLGFLGLVAALALPAFFRFLMLAGVSLALSAMSYVLEKRPNWQKFSSWIRGVAGAVALFACFGSAAVPGLKWIEDERAGLALITLGVFVNLAFARLAGRQAFASLHVLLSLVTLSILPQQLPVFVVAAVVALAGVALAYRSRWEHQALLVTASFAIYQIFRYQMAGGAAASFTQAERLLGIASTALVGLVALLMHYRTVYASSRFSRSDVMPFASHLVHWFSSVLGFILYSTGSKWNTIVLVVVALLCFALARRGRNLGIQWLYRTDTIVAQSVALFGGLTLTRWDVDPVLIAAILFIEGMTFVVVMQLAEDTLLEIVARVTLIVIGVGLFVTVLVQLDYDRTAELYRHALVLLVLVTAVVFLDRRRSSAEPKGPFGPMLWFLRAGYGVSPLEIVSGLFLIGVHTVLIRHVWLPTALSLVWMVLIMVQKRAAAYASDGRTSGLWGLAGAMIVSHIMLWVHVFYGEAARLPLDSTASLLLPFLLASLLMAIFPIVQLPVSLLRLPAIALVFLHLLLSSMRISQPVTPLLAGTLWLLFSLAGLELSLWIGRRGVEASAESQVQGQAWSAASRLVVLAAAGYVVAFVIRHVVVELQAERYLGRLPVRTVIESYAIVVFLYWFHTIPAALAARDFFWRNMQPLFLEAALAFTVVALELEFTQKWMMLAFALLPFVLLGWERARRNGVPDVSRLRLYALLSFWTAVFHLGFTSSISAMPAVHWLDRSWILGLVVLALIVGLVGWMHRSVRFNECSFPPPLAWLATGGAWLQIRRNHWIFDPAFAAAALFLFWSFDHAILTLLWVGLVFLAFVLSVLLREGHFRIMALIALAACLGRLILYDLSQTSLLMRAVVFVGVGILMLGMNSIYNRFKDRFV